MFCISSTQTVLYESTRDTNALCATQEGDPAPKTSASTTTASTPSTDAGGMGVGVYVLILVGGALAFFAYQFLAGGSKS